MITSHFINSSSGAQYSDYEISLLHDLFFGEGIFGDTSGTLGFAVTQNSPTAMNVLVALGNAFVELVKSGNTFKVVVFSDAQATVTIAPNSSGSNRVDAIILRVDKDAEPNSGKTNIATIEVVLGSGVSALTDGAIDTAVGSDGWIRLANITVPSGASSIVTGNIADTRVQVAMNPVLNLGARKIFLGNLASDPSTLFEGLMWYNSTSHQLKYRTNSATVVIGGGSYTDGDGVDLISTNFSVDSTVVRTTGAQSIDGIKTYTSIPVLPASDPTADNEMARKSYADAKLI